MINSCSETQQDTVKGRNIVLKDSIGLKSDSASAIIILQLKDSVTRKLASAPKPTRSDFIDTTSVCVRNGIADITFYDSNNIVNTLEISSVNRFPFLFTEKNMQKQEEARATLIKHLKQGQELPAPLFHNDWIVAIILVSAFLYSVISTSFKNIFTGLIKFVFFRGINNPVSPGLEGLFHWQSTLINFISFLNLSLFCYLISIQYNIVPGGISGIYIWMIFFVLIAVAVTIRHLICLITGNVSGEEEAFREYLLGIYQSYRLIGLISFVLVILISYTSIFPVEIYFKTGFSMIILLYLVRIFRLFFIFNNRDISIFYLILYLCALEILPVVISFKIFYRASIG